MKATTICPVCGHKHVYDFDTYSHDTEGQTTEEDVECPKCKAVYHCDVTVSVDIFEEEYEYESPEGQKGE